MASFSRCECCRPSSIPGTVTRVFQGVSSNKLYCLHTWCHNGQSPSSMEPLVTLSISLWA
ncbi:hypothetical protein BDA96_01G320400 [Sorghum bicolor]|uniref:Uncharacterized protein n=1 Tax=Sorghum bicolor TaxID=4558 RepID=A0A921S166_SORBI|nr:hypothetical protein BDA96_01G320400 [Sorghum bicolor]